LNASYEAWNLALADRFYRPDMAGRPVYLSVDDEELEGLAPMVGLEPHQASGSLAAAVCQEFSSSSFYGLYTRFFRATREWRNAGVGQRPPPYLGLHALAVLAGSRMARDETAGVASHNYYARYNELIGRDADGGRPPGFEELGRLWEDLGRWLEDDCRGERGQSTIRTHPTLAHIGFPISQCLLRAADRRRLTEFFRSVGLEPGDEITGEELFIYLRNWATPGCALSAPAARVIREASPEVASQIAQIVMDEFGAWHGEILDERGRSRSEIALVLEIRQGGHLLTARFWPRRPEGFPQELAVRLSSGRLLDLRAMINGWYEPLSVEVRGKELDRGLLLESDEYSFAYVESRVVPLRASEELGRWISVHQVRAAEPHCILAHTSALEDVRRFLTSYAEPGWRKLPESRGLPDGWTVFSHVQITSPAYPSEDHLRRLVPRFGTASSLEGGLKITSGQYLVGGEPDLWVTVAEGDETSVEIDGEPAAVDDRVVRFRLSEMGLAAGPHNIRVGGLTRRFTTFDGLPTTSPSGTGSLGHVLRRGRVYMPDAAGAQRFPSDAASRGTVRISGARAIASPADLPEPVRPPILLPAGFKRYTVLGRAPGEIFEPADPGRPAWLDVVGLDDQYQFFDVDQPLPFDAQWLMIEGIAEIRIRALQRPPAPPAPEVASDAKVARWCEAITRAVSEARCCPEDEVVLELYAERARKMEVPT
jgi:hypothetical protein